VAPDDTDPVPAAPPPRAVRTGQFSRLRQPVPLLVTGRMGAGKSKLIDAWDTGQRRQPAKSDRSEEYEQHHLEISLGRRFLIFPRRLRVVPTVVPGQPSPARGQAFGGATRQDRRPVGVIHTVCFGYDEIWDVEAARVRRVHDADPGDSAAAASHRLTALRAANLREEADDFDATAQRLAATWRGTRAVAHPWLVIALAKCDLYFAELDEAKRYYRGADPDSAIGVTLRTLTARVPGLRIEVVPVSCDPEPYRPKGLAAVKEPELDAEQAARLLDAFFRTVEDLSGAA
jgi:hypothetical protein